MPSIGIKTAVNTMPVIDKSTLCKSAGITMWWYHVTAMSSIVVTIMAVMSVEAIRGVAEIMDMIAIMTEAMIMAMTEVMTAAMATEMVTAEATGIIKTTINFRR